jgi:tRNA(Ile)-lysidine synthase
MLHLLKLYLMNIVMKPGKYVVAVSGGVDSMALLHALTQAADVELVVAHFEHGIRPDSMDDLQLVQQAAAQYDVPFAYAHGNLGAGVSEAAARTARYAFLRQVQQEHAADAIVTAHHEDDLLETALLNLLRGTGRKGLSSLRSTDILVRPLLGISKRAITEYAEANGLVWHEDSTNSDDRYLRNYLRHRIIPGMTAEQRAQLLQAIHGTGRLNDAIDAALQEYTVDATVARRWFIMLPHVVATEVMAGWLRSHNAVFDRKNIERLVIFAKTAQPGKVADVDKHWQLHAGKEHITLLAKPATS